MLLSSVNAPLVALLSLGGTAGEAGAAARVLTAPVQVATAPMRLGHAFPTGPADLYLRVLAPQVPVFPRAERDGWGIGSLARGALVAGRRAGRGHGCRRWVDLVGRGFVCATDGTELLEGPDAEPLPVLAPDMGVALPFRYAKLEPGAALRRRPTGPVRERASGVVFRAVDRLHAGTDMLELVDGTYVRSDAARLVAPPTATGQPLHTASLPLAFVIADDAAVYDLEAPTLEPTSRAERYARFEVAAEPRRDGRTFVVTSDGLAVAAKHVRVARARARPKRVPADGRWIHVDLDAQVLVAYEGDRPVYATLVATGKPGYRTPAGFYRIRRKYVSRRMRGPDPDHGRYDIGDVPWTMYYHGGLAMHGAYWHDEFGAVRSHGCTNLPPEAARWLFAWSDPDIPRGWRGIHEAGTWVYFTRA
jgi:lipoprotein-anchoring transpeptidase ErfK/SrfK